MAIATLAECYRNPKVFTGVVKIRKGMAARLIMDASSVGGVHYWFNHFAKASRPHATAPSDEWHVTSSKVMSGTLQAPK